MAGEGMGLLRESNSAWSDSDMPLEERGIGARFWTQFFKDVDGYRDRLNRDHDLSFRRDEVPDPPEWNYGMGSDLTSRALVEDHVVPWTKSMAAPLYARVPQDCRGKPTIFVSYSWDAPLLAGGYGVVYAVEEHFQAGDFVWMDIFCHNQHRIGSVAPQMEKVIGRVKRVVVPMSQPPWFTRCWCIWEVLCAFQNRTEISFLEYSRKDRDMYRIRDYFLSQFRSIAAAETSVAEDKALILAQAQKMFGSVAAADRYLLSRMDEVFGTGGTTTAPPVSKYDALKRTFREQGPPLAGRTIFGEQGPPLAKDFLNDVLWTLHRDPATARLELSHEAPPYFDIEALFEKDGAAITLVFRVDDERVHGPVYESKARYSLVDGDWQAYVLRNWRRS